VLLEKEFAQRGLIFGCACSQICGLITGMSCLSIPHSNAVLAPNDPGLPSPCSQGDYQGRACDSQCPGIFCSDAQYNGTDEVWNCKN